MRIALVAIVVAAHGADGLGAGPPAQHQGGSLESHLQFIDQDGTVLAATPLEVAVLTHDPQGANAVTDLPAMTTDAAGIVHIVGVRGDAVSVRIADDRYCHGLPTDDDPRIPRVWLDAPIGGNPSPHGTESSPKIIRVWRKQGPQPLIVTEGELRLAHDGKPLGLDLLTGRLTGDGSGDVAIAVDMPITQEARIAAADHRGVFPFRASISFPTGSLAPSSVNDHGFSSAAGIPADAMFVDAAPLDAKRVTGFIKIQRDRTLFGRIDLQIGREAIRGDRELGRLIIRLRCEINPTGSRSLEPTPGTEPKTLTDDSQATVP